MCAVTAVVASVCNAHSEKTGKAGLAVLTCREFFAMDRARMVQESPVPVGLADLMSQHSTSRRMIYITSDENPTRCRTVNMIWKRLRIKLQLGEQRDAVWRILDEVPRSVARSRGADGGRSFVAIGTPSHGYAYLPAEVYGCRGS